VPGALVLFLLASLVAAGDAVPGKTLKAALQRYKDALAKVRWTPNDGNIALLYARAAGFRMEKDDVLAAEMRDFLDHASDDQRKSLALDLEGLVLDTSGPLRASPDMDFFARLAKKGKASESRDFLGLYGSVHPSGRDAPVYLDPTAHCARAGEGIFVDVYRKLGKNGVLLPRYRPFIDSDAKALLDVLTAGDCICGGRDATLRELRRFVKAFPEDKALPRIRDRLRAMEGEAAGVRFSCRGP